MSDLIDRAPGDDVIVAVRMRRSSFEQLTSTADGHSVPVTAGSIGLVRDHDPCRVPFEAGEWTFVVWSGEPVWRGVPEQIPGNELSAAALAALAFDAESDETDAPEGGFDDDGDY
jgi:hypothetical protein